MNRNKTIVLVIAVGIIAGAATLGITALKKVRQGLQTPKQYDARPLLERMPVDTVSKDLKVFTASSLDRIFQDGKTLLKPAYETGASLSAAGHEYESFQVVLYSATHEHHEMILEPSDLVNAKTGDKIDKSNIQWNVVGYVKTLPPYYRTKYVGMWPDPLLAAVPFTLKANEVQPVWVTVYVPAQTPPGEYTGHIKVSGHDVPPVQVPLNLRVYNFTLPKASSLKTAFDFYEHITKIRYPQGDRESSVAWRARLDDLNDQFLVKMLKYRMNPILNVDPTVESELAKVDRYLVLGLNNFSIGKMGGTFNNNWPKDTPSIEALLNTYRTYGENLKLNRMLQYTYIYTWDEGDMGNPIVQKVSNMIHRAYPGLKNMVCYHGLWDPDQDPQWIKDIDIWTFNIDDYDETKYQKLKKAGKEMWMYVSGPANNGSPNLAMDFDSIDYRILPWMCWKYDLRGFLYWCVNWWPTVNPFEHARNSQWEQNGNGLLFYPGKDGPLASLRMEIFRDGMEDYEYIMQLLEKLQLLRSRQLESTHADYMKESIQLLTMDDAMIKNFTNFNKDGQQLKARRDAIAAQIEKFSQVLP